MIFNTITKTKPFIIHAPDKETNLWWKKILELDSKNKKNYSAPENLDIITWNNLKSGPFENGLSNKKIEHFVLGKNIKKWNNYYKFDLNVEFLNQSSKEFCMGCDSHDVLLIKNPKKIIETFNNLNCDILFNAEKFFYPDIKNPEFQKIKKFQFGLSNSPFKFLNSGAWIGKKEAALRFFEEAKNYKIYELINCDDYKNLKKDSIGCDQSSLHFLFVNSPVNVKLDYNCDIFYNIARTKNTDISYNFIL